VANLKLFLLGQVRLEQGGTAIKFPRRKMLALLAYLAVTDESYNRDILISFFWPEHDEAKAHAYLRNSLWSLREVLGQEWVCYDRDTISLEQFSDIWIDVKEFRRLASLISIHSHPPNEICSGCIAHLHEAVSLYRGDFMAGFSLRDSEQFNEWQFYEAEGLRKELAEILNRLAIGLCTQRQFEKAIHYARRYLALDKYNEQAHFLLINILAWKEGPAAALRQYQDYVDILKKEFGGSPSEEIIALSQSIKSGFIPPLPRLI
jgi:DNA-binding SARP family transcriptional activator